MKQGKDFKTDWETFVQDGDQVCFYNLYAHYYDYFTYLGLKKGASPQKTEDGINDLFLYIYENREKLGHIQQHHNYLITSFLRKLFRKTAVDSEESLDLITPEEMPTYPSVEAQHIKDHASEHVTLLLKSCIDRLTESQSKMVYQKFYLGLSYEEISQLNGISLKTAYNTIYNAVERLKKMIEKDPLGASFIAISLLSLLIASFLN